MTQHGGSCTGTGIVMAAAARSVGIPVRLVGCSQSVPGDDHHWVEFYDASTTGPFAADSHAWHTREGTSAGNRDGPWDAPSAPMNTCLSYLIPNDRLNTIWGSSWSGSDYMPLQWSNTTLHEKLSFVGGVNLCGQYCAAWGCGTNQTHKWAQEDCFDRSRA